MSRARSSCRLRIWILTIDLMNRPSAKQKYVYTCYDMRTCNWWRAHLWRLVSDINNCTSNKLVYKWCFLRPIAQTATADDPSRSSIFSSSEYFISQSFQLQTKSLSWLSLGWNTGTSSQVYGPLKTFDETLLLWETTVDSLTTIAPSCPSKYMN